MKVLSQTPLATKAALTTRSQARSSEAPEPQDGYSPRSDLSIKEGALAGVAIGSGWGTIIGAGLGAASAVGGLGYLGARLGAGLGPVGMAVGAGIGAAAAAAEELKYHIATTAGGFAGMLSGALVGGAVGAAVGVVR